MATPAGGKPIEPGLVQRLTGALRYAVTGHQPDWFGPNEPLPPVAPDSVKGRPWDFPVGVNLQYQPRLDQGQDTIDFTSLRRVSDPVQGGLDLIRIAIETRKDQMEGQKWTIKGRDGKDGGDRAREVEKALRRPDMVHTYRQWARPIWDDLLVIDAPAIYIRPVGAVPGVTAIPEQVDGATIKILIDGNGRTPMPPESAYQQVIKGLPAVDYTLQELIYAPRNLRSYRFYGMSPVEQVMGIANIALKRQLHLLNYYTDGTVPDAILTPPETWNPDQIKQAQQWLDTLTSPTARHKVRILPGGQFTQLRDPKLKDELDDWLARIICYCFSLAPGALVKDMTKATGDTNKTSAQEEGLEPLKLWWKDVMDEILVRCYAAEDLEFAYHEKEISDPQVKMTVWTGYKAAGIVTADEVRDKALGLDPMSEEQKAEVAPPPTVGLVAPGKPGTNGKPGTTQGEVDGSASPLPPASKNPTEKHAHAGGLQKKKTKVLNPINHDRALVTKAAAKVAKLFRSRFAKQRKALVAAVRAEATKLLKMSQDDFLDLWDELSDDGRDKLREALAEELSKVAVDGGSQGLTQVLDFVSADTAADLEAMLAQVNEQAVAFAEERAAELVGMKWSEDAGAWIVNPNAEWAIDDTTRSRIQTLTTQAEQEGWSNDKLADALQDDTGFSDDRAEMIARTETAFADIQGNLAGWEASGVVEAKEWSVSQDEVCDDCLALDGKIVGLDEDFPEGDPPLHPRCRCDLLPVVMTQAGIDAATAGGGTDAAE